MLRDLGQLDSKQNSSQNSRETSVISRSSNHPSSRQGTDSEQTSREPSTRLEKAEISSVNNSRNLSSENNPTISRKLEDVFVDVETVDFDEKINQPSTSQQVLAGFSSNLAVEIPYMDVDSIMAQKSVSSSQGNSESQRNFRSTVASSSTLLRTPSSQPRLIYRFVSPGTSVTSSRVKIVVQREDPYSPPRPYVSRSNPSITQPRIDHVARYETGNFIYILFWIYTKKIFLFLCLYKIPKKLCNESFFPWAICVRMLKKV